MSAPPESAARTSSRMMRHEPQAYVSPPHVTARHRHVTLASVRMMPGVSTVPTSSSGSSAPCGAAAVLAAGLATVTAPPSAAALAAAPPAAGAASLLLTTIMCVRPIVCGT